ncbi:sphingosine N-acyltransferase lag1 [Mortierella sp. AD011]|nr:sphingosine N-acyltransferase lag1 [Mortierella sp. AD010]KAF9400450.1 sphingosine N-acyltransferase lag1 [Mortierella sp. AD011]
MAPASVTTGACPHASSTPSPRLTSRERSNSFRRRASIDAKTGQPYHYDHRRHFHHDPTEGRSPSPPSRSAQKSASQSWASFLIHHQLVLSSSIVVAVLAIHLLTIAREAYNGRYVDWIANFSALIPPPIWKNMPLSWTRASLGGPAIQNWPKTGNYDPNESWSSMALTLQYQIINVDETTGEKQVLYGKGWNDLYMVLLWIMIWTAAREAAMTYIFIPLGRHFGVGGRKTASKKINATNPNDAQNAMLAKEEHAREGKLLRFAEQGWLVLYDGCMWTFGMCLLYNSQYWSDTSYYWRDYPKTQLDATMKWYYLIQFAFWFQQLLLAILGIEKRRKDFLEFMIHHIITCMLVGFSYTLNFTSVGHAVFCAMDFSDIVLAACKMLKYMGKDRLADFGFIFFVFTWIMSRHYYYGIIVWSVFTQIDIYGNKGWDPSRGMFMTSNVVIGFKVLLVSLYAVLLFWLFMILRIVKKVLNGENSQDVRSDDEDEEEVEEVENITNLTTLSKETLTQEKAT